MFINESSFKYLYDSTVSTFPRTKFRQHATQPVIIEHLHWTPFVGMKTLFIKGQVRNEDKHYDTLILFKGIKYGENGAVIKASDGLIYKFSKISLNETDVLLRCNCLDFYYRFNYYDHVDKSLYGRKRAKYESKGIGPPANPNKTPGMCKHLIKTIQVIKEEKIFNEF